MKLTKMLLLGLTLLTLVSSGCGLYARKVLVMGPNGEITEHNVRGDFTMITVQQDGTFQMTSTDIASVTMKGNGFFYQGTFYQRGPGGYWFGGPGYSPGWLRDKWTGTEVKTSSAPAVLAPAMLRKWRH